jgi:WD40 repeat protein
VRLRSRSTNNPKPAMSSSQAMSASSRNRAVSMGSGRTAGARSAQAQDFNTMPSVKDLKFFDSSAATASMFLYAQGSSIVCCHHDTLTIERRFSRHSDEVLLLAVDNQSDVGGGRFVVSYDAGQTAIVWDLMTGDEVARFASYEHLTVASWMRNGNVAFGNTQGSIILFEPTTSEHISARTLDQIAVTALAPSADCRTFAIG